MSDSFSDYSPGYSPYSKTSMEIPEIYEINKGNSGDWGIEGYQVPKKSQLLVIKESLFPKAKKIDMFQIASKRSKDPDPTKYSPTYDQTSARYWKPSNGKFPKAVKKSYIDEVIKLSPRIPGPGTYHAREKGKSETPFTSIMGKMDKGEHLSFLSTTEFYAEESPSPGQYFVKPEEREKAVKFI